MGDFKLTTGACAGASAGDDDETGVDGVTGGVAGCNAGDGCALVTADALMQD